MSDDSSQNDKQSDNAPEDDQAQEQEVTQNNVLGEPLEACSIQPITGFYRNGYCETGPEDRGAHTVCAEMSDAFLSYSASVGNDLSTPRPEFGFPGLQAGDRWCLCATRWLQALEAGVAPPIVLRATHESILELTSLETLLAHGLDLA